MDIVLIFWTAQTQFPPSLWQHLFYYASMSRKVEELKAELLEYNKNPEPNTAKYVFMFIDLFQFPSFKLLV